jgi:hypothetical protein
VVQLHPNLSPSFTYYTGYEWIRYSVNSRQCIAGTSRAVCPSRVEQAVVWIPIDPVTYAAHKRGDVNGDGRTDITDAINILGHLFLGQCLECEAAADVDNSLNVDITDPINLLTYLFLGGTAPVGEAFTCVLGE